MEPEEVRHEGRGILGRKRCGCIVAVNLGYTDRERRAMEAEYVVSEHTYAEARDLFNGFDHKSCTHGDNEQQLMAAVKGLERELAEWQMLRIWGGTPAHVEAFIKGQQDRIHATQDVERELAAANERIRRLEEAGDAMVQHFYTDEPRSKMWTQAKEAKP